MDEKQTRVIQRPIEAEMKKSYIDYAMSVIVGRALPDVRDGLKPVHRRILYAMYDMGLAPNKPHKKSARVVGECFVAGTRVLTERGLVRIEEVQRGEVVYTQTGSSVVKELYEMPSMELVHIVAESGMSVTATPTQPLKVLTSDLEYEWKLAKDLRKGDSLVVRCAYPNLPYPDLPPWQGRRMKLDESIAYIIGQFLSDGCYEEYNGRFCFFSASEEVMERVRRSLQNAFGYDATIEGQIESVLKSDGLEYDEVTYQIRVNRKELNEYISSAFGIDSTWKSRSKRIPEPFFSSPRSVLGALLSGMMDGDGSVHRRRNTVEYGTVSPQLADDVQVVLLHLGVLTRRYLQERDDSHSHRVNGHFIRHNHELYSIEIQGRFCRTLAGLLDLAHPLKRERLQHIPSSGFDSGKYDRIPHMGRKVFSELSECHLGAGWYEDTEGKKFRMAVSYPNGTKIRYSSDLREKPLGRGQLVQWGILENLNRIGSKLVPFIEDIIDNELFFVQVREVRKASPEITYDLQVEGSHEFLANGIVSHNCLGKYHPHGDLAVYDSLVRMAQDFSMRYPLIDGQGNFGSVDGDSAAAMRYTECRLARIADEMLADIDEDTVDFVDNFDGSLQEPSVLPGKLPNLLVNGSSGIAVGMATNIPPHNLNEVADAIVHLIDNPSLEVMELMESIKGPDFPTGGIIYGINGIIEAYSTGKGRLRVRARTLTEEHESRKRIVVTEIPYQVNKANLIESIAELVKEKRIEGITDLRDESDREGMRVVIELRKDAMEDIVLNQLFSHTQMEVTFGVINLALVDNEPKVLTLKETLQHYIEYRRSVVTRRTKFELSEAMKRDHILQGLIKAVDALDETLSLIRKAKTAEEARASLMERFKLTEDQARAILEMRLQKLTGLEIEGLRAEFLEIEARIRDLEDILSSEKRIMDIIKSEVLEVKEKHGDERKTEIIHDALEMDIEDLIPNEEMVLMITHDGYMKRLPLDTYKQQRRGGIGLIGMETKEEDRVTDLFVTSTHNYIMFFTNLGRVYWLKAYRVPVGGRHAKGKPIVNLLPGLAEGEKILDTIPVKEFDDRHFLVFSTKKGIIKKTPLDAYCHVRSSGIIALGLEPGDELVDTRLTDGTKEIVIATKDGQAVRFSETDVRPMGRPAKGVIGIRLYPGDEVVSMATVAEDSKLLTVTKNGYGKLSLVSDYRKTRRGGKGVMTVRTGDKIGRVISVLEVSENDELIVTSFQGMVIRIPVADIRVTGRATMGVRIMRLHGDDKVTAVARLIGEKEEMMVNEAPISEDRNLLPREGFEEGTERSGD